MARRQLGKIALLSVVVFACLFGCLWFYWQRCYPIPSVESLPEEGNLLVFASSMEPRCTLLTDESQRSLYIADVNTGELARWAIDGEVEPGSVYSWSPKQQQLLITGYTEQGKPVHAVSPNGSADRLPLIEELSASYAWSPDDEQVAFTYQDQIHVQNVDGTGLEQLTHFDIDASAATSYIFAIQPSWSPDGKELVFTLVEDRSDTIYRMNKDGTGLVALTDHLPGNSWKPKWSPDGTKIAFMYSEALEHPDTLWLMNPDGSEARQLLEPHPSGDSARGVRGLAWSPDSQRIAFFSGRDGPCSSFFREYEICSQSLYLILSFAYFREQFRELSRQEVSSQ
jgi:Tol biopolymer transport system component